MNYYSLIPLASFLINLFLFAYILSFPKKSRVHIAYMVFVLPLALWQLLDFFAWSPIPEEWALVIVRVEVALWLPATFLYLNFFYKLIDRKPDYPFRIFLVFAILFSGVGFFTDFIVTGIQYELWGISIKEGILYLPAIFISVIASGIYGLMLTWQSWKKETDIIIRKQLFLMYTGIAMSLFFGLMINVVLPKVFHIDKFPQIGSAAISIQSIMIFIAIVKYRIFAIGIKQSAYEVFSQVDDCVAILDRNKKVVEINKSAVDLLGLQNVTKTEINFSSLFGDDYSFEKDYNAKEMTCEINQERKTIILSQSALIEAGAFTGKLVILRDITSNKKAEEEIKKLNALLEEMVEERTAKLKNAQKEIVQKEYKSELADITSETLHNVKNILNSVKISSEMIRKIHEGHAIQGFRKANTLLRENFNDLEAFISNDPKGKKLMEYYLKLEEVYDKEADEVKAHVDRLQEKVRAIEEIVISQQNYGGRDMEEATFLPDIIEDALIMQSIPILSSNIRVVKEIEKIPQVVVQKTKVMHILVNLIKNAKEAMVDTPNDKRVLTFSAYTDNVTVFISLNDTGCGISSNNLDKMFTYGFTTKKGGHGFGLHSCENYMKEMGGRILVESEGMNRGATFFMQFPR